MLRGPDQRGMEPVSSHLRTVTGEVAPIRGKSNVRLKVGSMEVMQEVFVADIQDQCILGVDFLEHHSCIVNLRDSTLLVGAEEIPLGKPTDSQDRRCYRAVLDTSVQIPPHSETIVAATVQGLDCSIKWGIVEMEPGGGH